MRRFESAVRRNATRWAFGMGLFGAWRFPIVMGAPFVLPDLRTTIAVVALWGLVAYRGFAVAMASTPGPLGDLYRHGVGRLPDNLRDGNHVRYIFAVELEAAKGAVGDE